MWIIVIDDEYEKGAYSVVNDYDEKIILLFEEKEDAERYLLMLNEIGVSKLKLAEYEEDLIIKTCKISGFKYSKIRSHDFVVPPGYCDVDV